MPDDQQLLNLIADNSQGILAAVNRAGYPHLTNVLYVWNPAERTARVSTTADRVKAQILRRDPRAALHVPGSHFWSYVVAECDASVSDVATSPGDETCRELLEVHSAFYDKAPDEAAFFAQMIEAQRLIVRLDVKRLYGVLLDQPPGNLTDWRSYSSRTARGERCCPHSQEPFRLVSRCS
ncbi:MAG: pyridoxamine 5'-phosphate oxidase family protein [Solirubrobacteraceae bacterium]